MDFQEIGYAGVDLIGSGKGQVAGWYVSGDER
jgi:hypothetical protein